MADVRRANTLFGGTRSVVRAVRALLGETPRATLLLDVGAGLGDIPERVRADAAPRGIALTTIAVDHSLTLMQHARPRVDAAAVGDATALPIQPGAADVVTCTQLLHHFENPAALIAELNRVSRGWVVISDLRRSWAAAAGFWLASFALGFHPVTRHDGVVSVLRGFTGPELARLVEAATGATPIIAHGVFWRLSATWRAT